MFIIQRLIKVRDFHSEKVVIFPRLWKRYDTSFVNAKFYHYSKFYNCSSQCFIVVYLSMLYLELYVE